MEERVKTLNWIVTFLVGIIVSVLGWVFKRELQKIDDRMEDHTKLINENENAILRLEERTNEERKNVKEAIMRMEKSNEKILEKLDRLTDRFLDLK